MSDSTDYADMAQAVNEVLGKELAGYAVGLPRGTKLDPEHIRTASVSPLKYIYEVCLNLRGVGYSDEAIAELFNARLSGRNGNTVIMALRYDETKSVVGFFDEILSRAAR